MIETTIEKWDELIHGKHGGDPNAILDELLADDVVFYSPVVFTPQEGKAVTKLYLGAAASTFVTPISVTAVSISIFCWPTVGTLSPQA